MHEKKICAFFGHRNAPRSVFPALKDAVCTMIEQYGVTAFWCGGYGNFDAMAVNAVTQCKAQYPDIELLLIYAYLPKSDNPTPEKYDGSLYPDLENVPQRFAISYRNKWMARECDACIAYINHTYGGAYQAYHIIEVHGKPIINVGNSAEKT